MVTLDRTGRSRTRPAVGGRAHGFVRARGGARTYVDGWASSHLGLGLERFLTLRRLHAAIGTHLDQVMTTRPFTLAVLWTAVALTSGGAQPSSPRSAETRLFTMQSNFWVNLHHFLYVTARARRGLDARSAVTQALADTAGIGALPASATSDWEAALDYYSRTVAERDILFDSALVMVGFELSRLTGERLGPEVAARDSGIARALARAAPAYRTAWWPRHDSANRQWIAAARLLLTQHGDSMAAWITRAFAVRWPDQPVPVDVSAYSNWAGAYTTDDPDHITIASLVDGNQGSNALEMLFHEVLHTMDRTLFERLRTAARAQGKRMPRNPTHAFIFYSAGELARRAIPSHVPYAEAGGLWARSRDMGPMRPLLRRHWQPWLDGQVTLDEALRRIVAEL